MTLKSMTLKYTITESGVQYTIFEELGGRWWYKGKTLHRELGPAIECPNGDKWWYCEGKVHRLDGPAVTDQFDLVKMWYYKDKRINVSSQEEFEKFLRLKAFW